MNTDDELRGYYADLPADPAAEQRLQAVISGVGQHSTPESGTRRWLAVAATAAVVVAGTLSAYHLRPFRPTSAAGPSATASSGTSGASGTVPLTPRTAARILIDLLPKGESFGPVRGSAAPGRVTVSVLRLGPAEHGVVTVVVCHATATRTVADNCPVVVGLEDKRLFPADGPPRVEVVPHPWVRVTGEVVTGWEIGLLRPDGVGVAVSVGPDRLGRITEPLTDQSRLIDIVRSSRWQVRVPESVDAEARAHPLPDATFSSQPDPAESPPGPADAIPVPPRPTTTRFTVGPPPGTGRGPDAATTPTSTR